MLKDIADKLRELPKTQQRIVFGLGIVTTLFGFLAALSEWMDALRPGFIGASFGSLLKDYIYYLLGNKKEKTDGDTNAST